MLLYSGDTDSTILKEKHNFCLKIKIIFSFFFIENLKKLDSIKNYLMEKKLFLSQKYLFIKN